MPGAWKLLAPPDVARSGQAAWRSAGHWPLAPAVRYGPPAGRLLQPAARDRIRPDEQSRRGRDCRADPPRGNRRPVTGPAGGTGKTQLAVAFAHALWLGRWTCSPGSQPPAGTQSSLATPRPRGHRRGRPGSRPGPAADRFLGWLAETSRPGWWCWTTSLTGRPGRAVATGPAGRVWSPPGSGRVDARAGPQDIAGGRVQPA